MNGSETIVLIGGRAQHEFDVVRQLGYRILYLDRSVPLQCMIWSDVPVEVDVEDFDQVATTITAQLGGSAPAAVLTHVEPRIPLMAYLAEKLLAQPRGLSLDAAWNCRDKWRTRTVLLDAGLPVPNFGLAHDADEAVRLAVDLGFPVIVKPRDGAGAFGVRQCWTAEDVRTAAKAVLDDPGPGALPGVLVEEYLDGPEYAVQTVTRGGETRVLSVFRQHVTAPPVFVELGYDFPCDLGDDELATLDVLMPAVLQALGVHDWVSHTQVRRCADGFRVVEVNARRPGGRLVEMTKAVSGVDMTEAVSRIVLGLPVKRGMPQASHARYRSIVFEEAGILRYRPTSGDGDAIVEVEIAPGEPVQPVDHPAGGVYGRIVVLGNSTGELDAAEQRARAALELQVTPVDDIALSGADSREFKSCC